MSKYNISLSEDIYNTSIEKAATLGMTPEEWIDSCLSTQDRPVSQENSLVGDRSLSIDSPLLKAVKTDKFK